MQVVSSWGFQIFAKKACFLLLQQLFPPVGLVEQRIIKFY